jgi:hypothetical protein
MKQFSEFHKHSGCKHGVNTVCKQCRVPLSKNNYASREIEQLLWERAKTRAKHKGFEFNISIEDIKIPTVCPILGVPLDRPSIDRHDSSKGYIKGNIVVMSTRANVLKNNGTLEEFKLIVKYLESYEVVDL